MKLKSLFDNLSKDRKLRHQAYSLLENQGAMEPFKRDKILFLQLYYSTHLSGPEVLDLNFNSASKILEQSEKYNLPHLLRQQLNLRLDELDKRKELFSVEFKDRVSQDPYNFMREGLDRDFVDRLRANRVICSSDEFKVLPTPLRLNSDPRYSGKGICIAFLDGGFYPHPDIMRPHRRVVAYKDLASPYRP